MLIFIVFPVLNIYIYWEIAKNENLIYHLI